jgi:hypothetical protein
MTDAAQFTDVGCTHAKRNTARRAEKIAEDGNLLAGRLLE